MIGIINYGVGNLYSLKSSLDYLGLENRFVTKPEQLDKVDKIILPGVGAFKDAYNKLVDSGIKEKMLEKVNNGTYLLGVCLGMQMLFEKSYEFGEHNGLGLIKGEVTSLRDAICADLKVPHMGWNSLEIVNQNCPLLKYTKNGEYFYYVHSFYANNCEESLVAYSNYGTKVTGIVAKDNVFGTQFHPEKSGKSGLAMLKAFSEL